MEPCRVTNFHRPRLTKGRDGATSATSLRILVAGVGNVLRQDDGFGIAVVHHLLDRGNLCDGVEVLETGIAGIQ